MTRSDSGEVFIWALGNIDCSGWWVADTQMPPPFAEQRSEDRWGLGDSKCDLALCFFWTLGPWVLCPSTMPGEAPKNHGVWSNPPWKNWTFALRVAGQGKDGFRGHLLVPLC